MMPPFPVEEYKVLQETNGYSLSEIVNEHLQEGWHVWGVPYITGSYHGNFNQTMLKFKTRPAGSEELQYFDDGMFRST